MTRYFVDASGAYLGGFDGAEPPAGSIEVAGPPEHGACTWNGAAWSDPPEEPEVILEIDQLKEQLAQMQEALNSFNSLGG